MNDTNNKTPSVFSDMSGDPVYDYLKTKARGDAVVLGAYTLEPTRHSYNSQRKVIVVQVQIDGTPREFIYNYKKLEREAARAT